MLMVTLKFEPNWISGLTAIGLGGIGLILLLFCFRSIRATAMIAPWFWAVVAMCAVAGVEFTVGYLGWSNRSDGTFALRLVAAVSTFCPIVAMFGAKKPQNRVWQFVVCTLWLILSLPAAEFFFLGDGSSLQTPGFSSWFMLVLLLLHMGNTFATRFGISAALGCVAQWCLVSGYMPFLCVDLGMMGVIMGLALAVLALALVAVGVPRRRTIIFAPDRLWLDFRDAFGMLWGLRVAERINMIAEKNGWDVRLGWNGFQVTTDGLKVDELSPDVIRALRKNLRSLLRRFVSKEWIVTRTKLE